MTPDDDEDLRARGEKLAQALKGAQTSRKIKSAPQPQQPSSSGAAMSLALRASSEIVAGVVVGGLIGWGLDWLFHTKPAFSIVFLLLGSAAGIANVIRTTTPKSGT